MEVVTKDRCREVYTIGHSNRSLESFISTLIFYRIEYLVDVRRFPTSRKYPHFSKEVLEIELRRRGIEYLWLGEGLGGYRKLPRGTELHVRDELSRGFLAYVYHMRTEVFRVYFQKLLEVIGSYRTAIMCSEKIPYRCHRKLLSDLLTLLGYRVVHIIDRGTTMDHRLTRYSRLIRDFVHEFST
ncbi:MAG: DUF488 domain-containing protein [Thermoprotei archaeon]|nr:MAG: DUF488 domain-containing protein [Thermoprotei archaeon]RLE56777.1 MAG: DUF488 domain-containing protein [Thermoprotei archaeon]